MAAAYKYAIVANKIPKTLPMEALRMCDDGEAVDMAHAAKEHTTYHNTLKEMGLQLLEVRGLGGRNWGV